MPRELSSRLVQLITGHGFYGEYHERFNHEINPICRCGSGVESIAHALAFCPMQEGKRHILVSVSKDVISKELFASHAGLMAVSKFIAESGIGTVEGSAATALVL